MSQNFQPLETEKLINKYDVMPDLYYADTDPVRAEGFGNRQMMERIGHSPGDVCTMWEWTAGSAHLSATARDQGVSHLPPIDHRWGFHLGRTCDQERLLYSCLVHGTDCLFAAPTCTPWGGHARSWDRAKRHHERLHQSCTLQLLGMSCVIQMVLGRTFVIENPHRSDLWSDSALQHLTGHGIQLSTFDQCMYGAEIDGQVKTVDRPALERVLARTRAEVRRQPRALAPPRRQRTGEPDGPGSCLSRATLSSTCCRISADCVQDAHLTADARRGDDPDFV